MAGDSSVMISDSWLVTHRHDSIVRNIVKRTLKWNRHLHNTEFNTVQWRCKRLRDTCRWVCAMALHQN